MLKLLLATSALITASAAPAPRRQLSSGVTVVEFADDGFDCIFGIPTGKKAYEELPVSATKIFKNEPTCNGEQLSIPDFVGIPGWTTDPNTKYDNDDGMCVRDGTTKWFYTCANNPNKPAPPLCDCECEKQKCTDKYGLAVKTNTCDDSSAEKMIICESTESSTTESSTTESSTTESSTTTTSGTTGSTTSDTCAPTSKCGAEKACAENCKTTCGSKSCTCTPLSDLCPVDLTGISTGTDCWKAGIAVCTSGDGDDPCFARSSAHTCRLLDSTANPAAALADCFHGEARGVAEKVLMADLAAGDLVLGSADEVSRVLLVQHKAVLVHSAMVRIEHASGSIELTPDHILPLDGVLAPASEAKVGSLLDGPSGPSAVTSVSRTADAIINPLTTSGKILAAGLKGGPVVASHAPERLAGLLLSPAGLALTKYSAASGLSYLFPAAVQAFYDDRLEAFFSAHSAALGQAADALPAPVAITVAVAVDLGLAAAFAVDKLGGLALALVLAAALSLRAATGKPKRA